MQFKQKLAYMALGGLLVFMGMLLPALMNRSAVAQNNKRVASFDEITCKRLNIVDDYGRTYATLKKKDIIGSTYDMIQIFNPSGTSICSLGGDSNGGFLHINHNTGQDAVSIAISDSSKDGFVKVIGKDGKSASQLSIDEYGGVITAKGKDDKSGSQLGINEYGGAIIANGKDGKSFSQLSIDEYGGAITAKGKDGKSGSQLSIDEYGGVVLAKGKDGKSGSQLSIEEYGGMVLAKGKDGKSQSQLAINENGGALAIYNKGGENCLQASITDIGGGMIQTTDKNGYRTGRLP